MLYDHTHTSSHPAHALCATPTLRWCMRADWRGKRLGQPVKVHLKGRSLECRHFMWFSKVSIRVKDLSHNWQFTLGRLGLWTCGEEGGGQGAEIYL